MLPSFLPPNSFQQNTGSLFWYREIIWGSEQMTPRVKMGILFYPSIFTFIWRSQNTAKQIITALHFCVFLGLFHHNATQMPVGLGYLLKGRQCLWSPRTCLWIQMKKNCCTVSISLYKPRNSKVYDRSQNCSLSKWLQNYFLILNP